MRPEPSASFPSSTEGGPLAGAGAARGTPALRLVLGAWAGLVYLIYWLGYLGVR